MISGLSNIVKKYFSWGGGGLAGPTLIHACFSSMFSVGEKILVTSARKYVKCFYANVSIV